MGRRFFSIQMVLLALTGALLAQGSIGFAATIEFEALADQLVTTAYLWGLPRTERSVDYHALVSAALNLDVGHDAKVADARLAASHERLTGVRRRESAITSSTPEQARRRAARQTAAELEYNSAARAARGAHAVLEARGTGAELAPTEHARAITSFVSYLRRTWSFDFTTARALASIDLTRLSAAAVNEQLVFFAAYVDALDFIRSRLWVWHVDVALRSLDDIVGRLNTVLVDADQIERDQAREILRAAERARRRYVMLRPLSLGLTRGCGMVLDGLDALVPR